MRMLPARVAAAFAALALLTVAARGADPAAELMASFEKLSSHEFYKTRNRLQFNLSPEMQQQMEMAKSMGMGGMDDMMPKGATSEFAPGWRRTTTSQKMMSRKGLTGAPTMLDAKVIAVARTGAGATPKVATYIDCVECEKNQDQAMKEQLAMMATTTATSVVREVISAVAGGPLGIAAAVTNMAATNPAAQAAMANRASEHVKEEISLNRWKCRDVSGPSGVTPPASGKSPFENVKYLGERRVGDEPAKAYQVTVHDPSTGQAHDMTFYTSTRTGLPMKMELAIDTGEGMSGSMAMEYYDVDVPNQIDAPDCLK
jgi:hypothetical protein